jgi:hypothetical protein
MNYITVENLFWTKDGSKVDCVVDFAGIGKVPFSASPNDLPHSVEIYNRCVAGDFGPIADYVPQPDEGPQEPSAIPIEMQIPSTTPGEIL